MKKQTAVEWIVSKLSITYQVMYSEEINQAKAMEKEQMEDAWIAAHQAGRFEGKGIAEEDWQTFIQYYIETYGK